MKHFCLAIGVLLMQMHSKSQKINIIPEPVDVIVKTGTFSLSSSTVILTDDKKQHNSVEFFNDYLNKFYNFKLKKSTSSKKRNYISLSIDSLNKSFVNDGQYSLSVTKDEIKITANSYKGIFYGIQSLIQLLPTQPAKFLSIPSVAINDYPRFKYRGMHLDVGRHFLPLAFIKKYIDFIALHKMNTFHWHLTEDQGWRIEIKRYPKLTSVAAFRNGTIIGHHPGTGNDSLQHGGFYTQNEIKDVVKYASSRFIDVIPEIELPGHSSAAIAAYPELSCFPNEPTVVKSKVSWNGPIRGKEVQQSWGVYPDVFCPTENTFTFLEHVLDEVIQLFPSQYIHIGGDESPKESWKRSAFCQQLIKEKGLKDEHELQSYFIHRIEKYLNSKGRQIIGWDEILEGGLAPNATVMSWRGEEGGIAAAKQHHNVIMTPGKYVYFDHSQSRTEDSATIGGYLPLETVYNYEPIPKELSAEESDFILGAQGNVWTEYMKSPSKVEYMIFPRMSALSEVLWSPKVKKNLVDFEARLQTQFSRYDLWKVNYSKAPLNIQPDIKK